MGFDIYVSEVHRKALRACCMAKRIARFSVARVSAGTRRITRQVPRPRRVAGFLYRELWLEQPSVRVAVLAPDKTALLG
ncbi:MAG: hypothetical protein KatS3mg110_1412 [Pirellulaceae bacterium]|nr:MAG: hypothetical protein KatS3mg110_1412 [Pirellulaceae bacterium]